MGNVSTEQKLQLVQMIRAENQDNRMKMRSREKMLYGTESNYEPEELPLYARGYVNIQKKGGELHAAESAALLEQGSSFSSFKLRLILAVALFTAFLVLDAGKGNIAGITTRQLLEEINRDFDAGLGEVVFDFENNFPYTLFMK